MNNKDIKTLSFPGDKSIAHRLVLLSLLLNKKIQIENLPNSKDVLTSLNIVEKLGVEVIRSDNNKSNVTLIGLNKRVFEEEITLDCGNSGTTARLLCGILANLKGRFKLIGDESLSKRPMERVVRPLADLMGVNIRSTEGHLPIYIEAEGKTKPADFFNQTGSAQVKSAILFAGLAAEGETVVREEFLSRDHTERLLGYLQNTQQLGGQPACSTLFSSAIPQVIRHCEPLKEAWQPSTMDGKQVVEPNTQQSGGQSACSTLFSSAKPQVVRHCEPLKEAWQSSVSNGELKFCIPGDISSAAYFIVLSLITRKSLKIENLLLNPTRIGFLNVLKRMGADIEEQIKENDWEPIGDLIVKGGNLSATNITPDEIPSLIDELPILAIAMAFAKGKSRVSGASELRVKESDRISCLISQLKKAGVDCAEYEDGFEITGVNKIVSAELDSFNDHRLAMSFAVLACASGVDIKVIGRDSVDISFPEFYEYLEQQSNRA